MMIKGEGVGGEDDDDDEESKNHGESCSSSYSSDWVLITAWIIVQLLAESLTNHTLGTNHCAKSRGKSVVEESVHKLL